MIFVSTDGTNLDRVDDLYELYNKVGHTIHATIANSSQEYIDFVLDDIARCEELLQYLRERVETELTDQE